MAAKKKWIQGAVNPAHKGYCSPMSKSTCTPARKALALRFKAMIRANSMRQLCRQVSQAICDAESKRRRFPMEYEMAEPPRIITPNGF